MLTLHTLACREDVSPFSAVGSGSGDSMDTLY